MVDDTSMALLLGRAIETVMGCSMRMRGASESVEEVAEERELGVADRGRGFDARQRPADHGFGIRAEECLELGSRCLAEDSDSQAVEFFPFPPPPIPIFFTADGYIYLRKAASRQGVVRTA